MCCSRGYNPHAAGVESQGRGTRDKVASDRLGPKSVFPWKGNRPRARSGWVVRTSCSGERNLPIAVRTTHVEFSLGRA